MLLTEGTEVDLDVEIAGEFPSDQSGRPLFKDEGSTPIAASYFLLESEPTLPRGSRRRRILAGKIVNQSVASRV